MNHSNNNKSAQKVAAELIDLDETYPTNSPLKEDIIDDQDQEEPLGHLSENDEIIMVSGAPLSEDVEQLISGSSNVPLQSIENVQKLPESNIISASSPIGAIQNNA